MATSTPPLGPIPAKRRPALEQPAFLPVHRSEMDQLGWEELDILLVSGDGYVDHPAFGAALLGRWLVHHGFRVGVVAQPRWDSCLDIARLGRPRLFAGITAGALDSMLAHYTAFRKKRSDDAYTPGGVAGQRPNRAAIVYANLVRRAFHGLPLVLGGIEASLRRSTHFDFWTDGLRRSILLDSKADAVLYGMAESSILALATQLDAGAELHDALYQTPGAVFVGDAGRLTGATLLELPAHEAILATPRLLIEATRRLEQHVHQNKDFAVQETGGRTILMAPPGAYSENLDLLYSLPFSREQHPAYAEKIPAVDMIRTSLATHRGCAGGCSFCSLSLHQGRRIRSRSQDSILAEAAKLTHAAWWTGSLSDVGGPSANMWGARCTADPKECDRPSCLTPELCSHFACSQAAYVDLLRRVQRVQGVRHVRVASGWRMDLALREPAALGGLIREFVGGQVKVAPEHTAPQVLKLMRKPGFKVFEAFLEVFKRESDKAGKEQYVIPYLMSAFPGCTDADMAALASWLRGRGWRPQQVQCFIPLPGTMAAALFYAGVDHKGNTLPVARSDAARLRQHHLLVPASKPGLQRITSKAAACSKGKKQNAKAENARNKATGTGAGRKRETR